jgi:3-(3-hydroxy-phenyl)propionate hydroxylase
MGQALDCDVLIVGLGPVGAALAALLADEGVDVIAIDRSTEVYPLPRAAHFDHEIMRVWQKLGVADAVLAHARTVSGYEFRNAAGEVLLSFGGMDAITASGWASGYMFNQPGLERALRAKLAASPTARVILGAAFAAMREAVGGVEARIDGPDGPLSVRAKYLIGCDGAWSPVREAMGAGLEDLQFDEPWLVIDAVPRPGCELPKINLQICDPARPTTCVLMGPGRHRWEFMMLPGETAETVLDDAFIARLLAPWKVDVEIERKAVYRFHGLIADRWRRGRVLIAGDAAHQTPPFAGQGMCAGVRDAANLSWKLVAVLRGEASDSLLDTYQVEREPNARAYIQLAIGMGRVVCTLDPAAAAARDAQMLAARQAGQPALPPASPPPMAAGAVWAGTPGAGGPFPQPVVNGARLDDALPRGAWLILRKPAGELPATLAAMTLDDARLAPFRDAVAGWLDAKGVDAVLVRPDRMVFGAGAAGDLVKAWSAALGAPAKAAA